MVSVVLLSVFVALSCLVCSNIAQALEEADTANFFNGTDRDAYSMWLGSTGNNKYAKAVFLPSSSNPGKGAAVHWSIDEGSKKVHIGVAARATGWVGFGLSENGGMSGADIVLYSAKDNTLTDSYATAIGAPIPDDCQNWELESSQSDGGFLIFEASRDLDTGDSQDWPIIEDENLDVPAQRVIAAWGDSEMVQYHGSSDVAKGSTRFYGDGGDSELTFHASMAAEAEGHLDLRAVDYAVLTNETDYAFFCFNASDLQSQNVPLDKKLHVIGFEAVVDPGTAKYVHHYILMASPSSEVGPCWQTEWNDMIYVWAPGDDLMELPKNVGAALGKDGFMSFLLQIHYNNPMGDEGAVDSSGVRLHYTSQTREHDLGILQIGDPSVGLHGQKVGRELSQHDFFCPSSCTAKNLMNDITVIGEYLHMHKVGLRMTNNQIRDGEAVHTGIVDYYDFDQMGASPSRGKSFVIKPGDEFHTTCFYSDPTGMTTFGLGSQDEMCIVFLFYYPRVNTSFPFLCGIPDEDDEDDGEDGYGDCNGSHNVRKLPDMESIGREFGHASETCRARTENSEQLDDVPEPSDEQPSEGEPSDEQPAEAEPSDEQPSDADPESVQAEQILDGLQQGVIDETPSSMLSSGFSLSASSIFSSITYFALVVLVNYI